MPVPHTSANIVSMSNANAAAPSSAMIRWVCPLQENTVPPHRHTPASKSFNLNSHKVRHQKWYQSSHRLRHPNRRTRTKKKNERRTRPFISNHLWRRSNDNRWVVDESRPLPRLRLLSPIAQLVCLIDFCAAVVRWRWHQRCCCYGRCQFGWRIAADIGLHRANRPAHSIVQRWGVLAFTGVAIAYPQGRRQAWLGRSEQWCSRTHIARMPGAAEKRSGKAGDNRRTSNRCYQGMADNNRQIVRWHFLSPFPLATLHRSIQGMR